MPESGLRLMVFAAVRFQLRSVGLAYSRDAVTLHKLVVEASDFLDRIASIVAFQ